MRDSYFDGTVPEHIGYFIFAVIITSITLGLAYPWAYCMYMKWQIEHTVVSGRRLYFDGKGTELFRKYIKWYLLAIVTIGIYSLWIPIKLNQWIAQHTYTLDEAKPDFFG